MGSYFKDEDGVGAVEYVLLVALSAVADLPAVSQGGTYLICRLNRVAISGGT